MSVPLFKKSIVYSDKRTREDAEREVKLLEIAGEYGFAPRINSVKYSEGGCDLFMEKITGFNLADRYGEQPSGIPDNIWPKIRKILSTLYNKGGIEYVDITPYNFMKKGHRIYIIDFGDAFYTDKQKPINWFLKEFLEGENSWNPDFA